MTAAPPLLLPGGRVLHGWWQKLSPLQPHRLWFAHLLLYRVEALVEAVSPLPLASLAQSLFALLARTALPVRIAELSTALHLSSTVLVELMRFLEQTGRVRPVSEGGESWEAVPAAGPVDSPLLSTVMERRPFFFTEGNAPLYLPLLSQAATPVPPPDGCRFDLAVLERCIEQSPEWKAGHGFPKDILRIAHFPGNAGEDDWLKVPLIRIDQALLVLVEAKEAETVTAFPVRQDGWSMAMESVLSLPDGVKALFPLLEEVGLDVWKPAWQTWCQQRNLPAGEVEACKLELLGHRLVVRAPARLIERLRAARSDALKGEAWLLAGGGRGRATAMIDLGETTEDKKN